MRVKSVKTDSNKPDTFDLSCIVIAEVVGTLEMPIHDVQETLQWAGHEHVTAALSRLIILAAVALGLAACSKEAEYSNQQRACIAQRYSTFDARKLDQCVDVCITCMNGNAVTCNTSCKLKGAG